MKRTQTFKASGIITITTDFGIKDSFVGQMKGVILSINKNAKIVDITHEIEPFSVQKANHIISEFFEYYPIKTVHIGVVDPGVGSKRRGLAIECKGHFFVGPDNGIFSNILNSSYEKTVVEISNSNYILRSDSPTFQGRDVFAAIAGWLSKGANISDFGKLIDNPVILSIEKPKLQSDMIIGKVISIDRFGNCITDIQRDYIMYRKFYVYFGDEVLQTVNYYEEAKDMGLSCIINSSGFLELFIYKGRASDTYDIKEGQKLIVKLFKLD